MKHGGDLSEAKSHFGGASDDWLDLSTGINPTAYPHAAPPDDFITRLPEKAHCDALIAAARIAYAVPGESAVVAAPGTQALIQWLPHLAPAGDVAVLGPTYSEHALAFRAQGRRVSEPASLDAVPSEACHLVVVNPNNPDGRILPRETLQALARKMQGRGGWLIIDEAFVDTCPEHSAAQLCVEHPVVILRSFGKFFGLAGLRLGFAVTREEIGRKIAGALGQWAVSGQALAIGRQALEDREWQATMRDQLARQAASLDLVLTQAGMSLVGGTSLYRLVRIGNAQHWHHELARRLIWVRRFDWAGDLLRFGLPRDARDLARLERALSEVAHGIPAQGTITGSPSRSLVKT
jgi:cobalamin biosynthesis protein CobC